MTYVALSKVTVMINLLSTFHSGYINEDTVRCWLVDYNLKTDQLILETESLLEAEEAEKAAQDQLLNDYDGYNFSTDK